ncbi:PPE family protein [Mycobacterium tuberculosis]|uniref:PPE family protein n=1 Tax=Mycobacterium tuberculosis TaxID=1773 RepID=UPI000A17DD47|nr:PPE family protein [Mycobacterium tuberculosis]BAX29133.1 putative PPE family protein PPE58 [Mycobacterium tuberculosis]
MHLMIPAEYISNVIYEGPRADSLYAADQRLRQLADSVRTTAESLNTTLDELHENWKGSSSEWMADAALRYLDWLSKHSRQILRTARMIESLVMAYEETLLRVVPPATIANNREEVRRLIASNVAGVNTPAIADLEAQYEQYRAENIQAMDRYLSWTRFALSKLPRWREPPQIHRSG